MYNQLNENTDFGRKIFFLNPPFDFQNIIMPVLMDMEYEIYILNDYTQAKNILRAYPQSICFVCIDSQLPVDHWYNFVMSFMHDPVLADVFLGVLTERAGKADREHFLLNTILPAGFILLNTSKDELIETLASILEINGAKGQRKYVRADCRADKLVSAQCVIGGMTYFLNINDISSVGLSCGIQPAMAVMFPQNMLIRDFTLNLRGKTVKCNAIILRTVTNESTATIVMLFTKGMPYAAKTAIKQYIRFLLQRNIDMYATTCLPDTTDYSKLQLSESFGTDDAFLIEFDEEEVLYADDVPLDELSPEP